MIKNKDCWSHKHNYPIEEIWKTHEMLAREIAPRLRAFKALDKHGYAPEMNNMEQWDDTIQKMIDAFELLQHHSPEKKSGYPHQTAAFFIQYIYR